MTPQPGDFFVVNTGTRLTLPITAAEWLDDKVSKSKLKWTDWDHAGLCTGATLLDGKPVPLIVEATPEGAVETAWHYDGRPYMWSSGHIGLDTVQRNAIASQALYLVKEKVGYSFLDYAALTAHALHLSTKWLQNYIGDSGHMICSQLVDYCYEMASVHLFDDQRWSGFVTPSDLGSLIVT